MPDMAGLHLLKHEAAVPLSAENISTLMPTCSLLGACWRKQTKWATVFSRLLHICPLTSGQVHWFILDQETMSQQPISNQALTTVSHVILYLFPESEG